MDEYDKIYDSKRSGQYKIISTKNTNNKGYVDIQFLNTGYIKKVRFDHALEGNVRDDSTIRFARPGIVTNGDSKKFYRLYKRWDCMMHRCYDKDNMNYKYYGAIGVTVCERWFQFANFIYDVQRLPGYNKFLSDNFKFHLDKDFLQHYVPHNQRIYSPDTCLWMGEKDNIKLSYKLDILFSSGCTIHALWDGNYSANIVVDNRILEYGVYDSISDIFDNFIYLATNANPNNKCICYNNEKEMCKRIYPVIEMCKSVK